MDNRNIEDLSEQMFYKVVRNMIFQKHAKIHSKMKKQLDLNSEETEISKKWIFHFMLWRLAFRLRMRQTHG